MPPLATESKDAAPRCGWAHHCPDCKHLLMFCTCAAPAFYPVTVDGVTTYHSQQPEAMPTEPDGMKPPTMDDVKAALFADLEKAEKRYKRLTLDACALTSIVQSAKTKVRDLRITLETLNLYCDTWEMRSADDFSLLA